MIHAVQPARVIPSSSLRPNASPTRTVAEAETNRHHGHMIELKGGLRPAL